MPPKQCYVLQLLEGAWHPAEGDKLQLSVVTHIASFISAQTVVSGSVSCITAARGGSRIRQGMTSFSCRSCLRSKASCNQALCPVGRASTFNTFHCKSHCRLRLCVLHHSCRKGRSTQRRATSCSCWSRLKPSASFQSKPACRLRLCVLHRSCRKGRSTRRKATSCSCRSCTTRAPGRAAPQRCRCSRRPQTGGSWVRCCQLNTMFSI